METTCAEGNSWVTAGVGINHTKFAELAVYKYRAAASAI